MNHIFRLNTNRKIIVASQNIFWAPVKHPSRTLNEHIISYVIKGRWKLDIGGEIITVQNDDVFIQPGGIPHIGIENCPAGTRTMFVHFSIEDGDECINVQPPQNKENYAYINTLVATQNHPQIKKILIKIIEECTKGNHIKASSYLNILLCELSEISMCDKSKYALGANIKKILANPTNKNFSNEEIAKILNVGVRTAETTFKECFGLTMHKYQLIQKIEHAKFCLEYYPEMKIIDISLGLGFYDEFHFSRQFKKIVGISPSEYRKMNHTK